MQKPQINEDAQALLRVINFLGVGTIIGLVGLLVLHGIGKPPDAALYTLVGGMATGLAALLASPINRNNRQRAADTPAPSALPGEAGQVELVVPSAEGGGAVVVEASTIGTANEEQKPNEPST